MQYLFQMQETIRKAKKVEPDIFDACLESEELC